MVPIFRNLFLLYLMSHRTVIVAISLNLAFKGKKKNPNRNKLPRLEFFKCSKQKFCCQDNFTSNLNLRSNFCCIRGVGSSSWQDNLRVNDLFLLLLYS